ncbi:MAG TPA: ROK family protein [Bryobacteraceae bacterium]|jgi:fructokinase
MYGAIEAGGTKFVCGVGNGPDDLLTTRIATAEPEATVAEAIAWLRRQSAGQLRAVGIGSFGPLDLKTGHITSTPKAAWRGYDLAGAVEKGLRLPVRFDTDVNAAVLGEARWGAAKDVSNCLYLTIGTGIGGGVMVEKQVVHGLTHPEMGHIRIPHDIAADPYAGACPYHGDCLEGLASGPAIQGRWGIPGQDLPSDHQSWLLEARYLALGIATFICTLSPERILIGGGVMRQAQLYGMINKEVIRILAGYVEKLPDIIPPLYGDLAGVIGALALART